jgi:hypothetical protein
MNLTEEKTNFKQIVMWEERQPKINDTVKVFWSEWYAKIIGCDSSIGIVTMFTSNKTVIDIGDRKIWLQHGTTYHVFTQ